MGRINLQSSKGSDPYVKLKKLSYGECFQFSYEGAACMLVSCSNSASFEINLCNDKCVIVNLHTAQVITASKEDSVIPITIDAQLKYDYQKN